MLSDTLSMLRANVVAILVGIAGTTVAMADPMGMAATGAATAPSKQAFAGDVGYITPTPSDPGYGPRVNPLRGVFPNDRVSMTLTLYDAQLNSSTVNTSGDFRVQRSIGAVDGGSNRNGTGRVMFTWDEIVSGTRTYIRATIGTSNNEPLMPATSRVPLPGGGTSPAAYWSWHFGTIDPVNYQTYITGVTLVRSSISMSSDGGQSYFSTLTTTSGIANSSDWRPGSDPGQLMTSIGDGTNFVLLQYEVNYVPNTGSVALLGAGVMTMLGNRRRRL
jgi:hypothetical protein